jgi:predicted aspartyl protease
VPVAVNGLPPMDFLLDTGSTDVALPAEVVFTLWRTATVRSGDFIGNRTYVLADGRRLPSPTFRIRELRVGQHVIRDAVGSLSPALTTPLLGGSFLSRFASWRIDNQRNALILSP